MAKFFGALFLGIVIITYAFGLGSLINSILDNSLVVVVSVETDTGAILQWTGSDAYLEDGYLWVIDLEGKCAVPIDDWRQITFKYERVEE